MIPDPSGTVTLPDGRVVAWHDGGDPDGFPVLGLHGTPGCRLARWPDDGLYARAGVRYVTTDRAGYGRSSRHHGRSVADEASDVQAVVDALGWAEFSLVGGSGGGPHALACAAALGPRLVRVACQSSIAPIGAGGLSPAEWVAGMSDDIGAELGWAEEGEARLATELARCQAEMVAAADADPTVLLGDGLSDGDVAFLARPDLVENWRRIVAEQARDGVGGAVDDSLAFARPWGVDLGAITVPVLVTHGAEDVSAPLRHGRWLAEHVPTATLVVSETGGHLPEDPEAEITATMRWLATGR